MVKRSFKMLFVLMISTLLISCGAKNFVKDSYTGTKNFVKDTYNEVFTDNAPAPSFVPCNIEASQYVPKVDNFVVVLDTSSSMEYSYKGKEKIVIAKDFLSAMNQSVPELNYNATFITFGGLSYVPPKPTKLIYGPTKYSTLGFGEALDSVKDTGGTTSLHMARGIDSAGNNLMGSKGSIAVIIVSDGRQLEDLAPLKAVKALKKRFGDRLCVYTVLVGDDPSGKLALEQITDAGGCGIATTADQLTSSDEMCGFVEEIFITKQMDSDKDGVTDDKDQCPNTPIGVTVDERGCWTYSTVILFDFDKSEIKPEAKYMLDDAVMILKKNPKINVTIEGHADATGPAEYNMALSERRANAVMNYLIDNGISAERLKAEGFGETKPAFSNDTVESRSKNRRVEFDPVY